MNAVSSRLGDDVQHGAAELSVFSVKTIRNKPEFFDGVQIRNQPGAQVTALAHIASIDQKGVRSLVLAVDGHVARRQRAGNGPVATDGARSRSSNSGLQAEKIDVAPAVERQRQDLLRLDNIAQLRGRGFYLHSISAHFNCLLNATHFERDVDFQL